MYRTYYDSHLNSNSNSTGPSGSSSSSSRQYDNNTTASASGKSQHNHHRQRSPSPISQEDYYYLSLGTLNAPLSPPAAYYDYYDTEEQLRLKWMDNSPRMSRLRENRRRRLINKLEVLCLDYYS